MKLYFFHYMDANGQRRFSWQKAENAADCCALLARAGVYPVFLWGVARPRRLFEGAPRPRALALFFRQLSVALDSGVPILEALHHIGCEQASERMRAFVARLEERVFSGRAFSEALGQEKGVAAFLASWVAIGEKQGRLAEVLDEVRCHLEGQERLRRQLCQQLLYPSIVLVALLLVGGFLSLVALPMLARQFMDVTADLPLFMRIFLVIHDFLAAHGWLFLLALLAVGAGLFFLWHRAQHGRALVRRLVMAFPLSRKLVTLWVYVPFARLFGQLLHSGVPVGETMVELERYFAASFFASEVGRIAEKTQTGDKLSQAIAGATFVPELARQMLMNGERYGRLPEALRDSAAYYEQTIFEELGLWLRFVEPLLVVVLGVLVLFLALGLFVPLLDAYQALLTQ